MPQSTWRNITADQEATIWPKNRPQDDLQEVLDGLVHVTQPAVTLRPPWTQT